MAPDATQRGDQTTGSSPLPPVRSTRSAGHARAALSGDQPLPPFSVRRHAATEEQSPAIDSGPIEPANWQTPVEIDDDGDDFPLDAFFLPDDEIRTPGTHSTRRVRPESDPPAAHVASTLERMARRIHDQGTDALRSGARDPLEAILGGVIAAYLAGKDD